MRLLERIRHARIRTTYSCRTKRSIQVMNRSLVSSPVRIVASAAALLLAGSLGAAASSVTVPNNPAGGNCTGGPNNFRFSGNCGALFNFDGTNAAYVQDDSASGEGEFRVRFYSNFAGRGAVAEPPADP